MTAPCADFTADEIARGESLFRQPVTFLKGVVNVAGLPPARPLEIAFAGRSNVGKSSLINALVGQKSLARTSNTPGRTREINFFSLGEKAYLVDLPGYGYARAAKTQVRGWTRLMENYLKGRPALARVFLLIDSRHGLKDSDRALLALMDEAAVSYQGVLTKIDKLKAGEADKAATHIGAELATHPAAYPTVIATSALKGMGLPELRAAIGTLARLTTSGTR